VEFRQNGKRYRPLRIIDPEEWKLFQLYNTSYYGQMIMRFAQRWANEIEKRLAQNKPITMFEINNCFDLANLKEGVTQNQISAAVEVLIKCWQHGDLLKGWLEEFSSHNNYVPPRISVRPEDSE
jgi:hypothetical protein